MDKHTEERKKKTQSRACWSGLSKFGGEGGVFTLAHAHGRMWWLLVTHILGMHGAQTPMWVSL